MKFVLTGCDPLLQPDLTRRVVITPAFFSLTLDGFDPTTGRMRFNRTVKIQRAFASYRIQRPDTGNPSTHYIIGGNPQGAQLKIRVFDTLPNELFLTLYASNDRTDSTTAIPGPTFQLDDRSRPAWHALVELMLRSTDLGHLPLLATTFGAINPDQVSVNWLAHRLTSMGMS